jgi:hypothetical protein
MISEAQATAIVEYVPYVVGMSKAIGAKEPERLCHEIAPINHGIVLYIYCSGAFK